MSHVIRLEKSLVRGVSYLQLISSILSKETNTARVLKIIKRAVYSPDTPRGHLPSSPGPRAQALVFLSRLLASQPQGAHGPRSMQSILSATFADKHLGQSPTSLPTAVSTVNGKRNGPSSVPACYTSHSMVRV